ncbi:MAG: DMT family transporter [Clostridia bacterium]|nr:DMT family transporter [Clostridia bacterium]
MEYLLLSAATMTSAAKSLFIKAIGNEARNRSSVYILNSLIFTVSAAVVALYALISRFDFSLSPETALLSLAFAACVVFSQTTESFAMKYGSASMTILIYSLGLILPIAYGYILLGENISLWQLLGMMLVLVALYFIVDPRLSGKINILWLVLSLLAAVGSGFTAIIQKAQQTSASKNEIIPFLILAFIFASLLSFLLTFTERCGIRSARGVIKKWRFILFNGVIVGALNIINLILAGRLAAVVQFPIYNIGSMILTGLGGFIIFKEKLSKFQFIGFGIGCVAILMIGLF